MEQIKLTFNDFSETFGHLIWYDDAHNDPPAELHPIVNEWINTNIPKTKFEYGDLLDVELTFQNYNDFELFIVYSRTYKVCEDEYGI